MKSPITTEQTTVFRATWKGASVRRFTKRAAITWLAWQMIKTNPRWECYCEPSEYDTGYPGITCDFHLGKANALHWRMVRYLTFLDKQARKQITTEAA